MKPRVLLCTAIVAASAALSGCNLLESQLVQLKQQIAAEVLLTLTAGASTKTPELAHSATPSPTPEASATPTPLPEAEVLAGNLNLREGPGTLYPSITTLLTGTKIEVLGQFAECSWWKVRTPDGVEGWIKGGEGFVRFEEGCALVPYGSFRPPTGTFVIDRRANTGTGSLSIQNGGRLDALIALSDEKGSPVIAFYLRGGDNFTLGKVPDGIYLVQYVLGTEWNGDQQTFMRAETYRKLDEQLVFATTAGTPTQWSISLQATEGGVGKSSEIEAEEFPVLK